METTSAAVARPAAGPLGASNDDGGWCPFAERAASPNYWVGHRGRRAVVIHIAQGSYAGSINWLTNPASKVSAHFMIARDGRICQMVSTENTAWANGLRWRKDRWWNARGKPVAPTWTGLQPPWDPNLSTISIEHEGKSGEPWPEAMLAASVRLLQWIGARHNLVYVAGTTLIGHAALDPVDRPFCPGPGVDLGRLAEAASGPAAPTPALAPLSADTPICGPATGEAAAVVAAIRRRLPPGSEYARDVETIVGYYWRYCAVAAVDPFMAATQCVFETKALTSFWAGRPRRNPANLGVTGQISTKRPSDTRGWWWDRPRNRWLQGATFATWEQAVQAHLGHLLLYALPDAAMNAAQLALSKRSPRRDLLNSTFAAYRGSAPRWLDLDGRWKAAGEPYAGQLVALANAIRSGTDIHI